jgi:hypothetical protein
MEERVKPSPTTRVAAARARAPRRGIREKKLADDMRNLPWDQPKTNLVRSRAAVNSRAMTFQART